MGNTKALEVATNIFRGLFIRRAIETTGQPMFEPIGNVPVPRAAALIQTAIDEATADLKAQLAERDAQLAAERAMADTLAETLETALPHITAAAEHANTYDPSEFETGSVAAKHLAINELDEHKRRRVGMSVKTADLVEYLEEGDWHQVAFGMWMHKDMDEETYTLEQAVACEKQMETKKGY